PCVIFELTSQCKNEMRRRAHAACDGRADRCRRARGADQGGRGLLRGRPRGGPGVAHRVPRRLRRRPDLAAAHPRRADAPHRGDARRGRLRAAEEGSQGARRRRPGALRRRQRPGGPAARRRAPERAAAAAVPPGAPFGHRPRARRGRPGRPGHLPHGQRPVHGREAPAGRRPGAAGRTAPDRRRRRRHRPRPRPAAGVLQAAARRRRHRPHRRGGLRRPRGRRGTGRRGGADRRRAGPGGPARPRPGLLPRPRRRVRQGERVKLRKPRALPSLRLGGLSVRSFFRARLTAAALAALTIIPLLYSGLYLWSYWDPFDRMSNLPVALVNEDRPVQVAGEELNAGAQITDELLDGGDLNWKLLAAADAEAGVADGRYYVSLTIPEDFSERLSSPGEDGAEPIPAMLEAHYNDANGYIVRQLMSSAFKEVRSAAADSAVAKYLDSMFVGFNDIHEATEKAADGASQLADGASEAKDGSSQLADGTSDAKDGADELNGGLGDAKDGSSELSSGIDQLYEGSKTLADGAGTAS